MLKKIIMVLAVMLLSAGVSMAEEAVVVSTTEVVAGIDRESASLYAVTAAKQGHRYFEEYEKAHAQENKIMAKIQVLDEKKAAEREKLSATLAANRQLQAGCLTGYVVSLTSVINYNLPNLAAMDETKGRLDGIIKNFVSMKEEKTKVKFLAKLETSQAKLAEAKRSLLEMLAYLEQVKSTSESRMASLNQETVVTTENKKAVPLVGQ